MRPVLEVNDLATHIQFTKSVVQAVGNVDLQIEQGEPLGRRELRRGSGVRPTTA
jgi:ABC-type microcin C transport system duplicated ATPase subunit YejF